MNNNIEIQLVPKPFYTLPAFYFAIIVALMGLIMAASSSTDDILFFLTMVFVGCFGLLSVFLVYKRSSAISQIVCSNKSITINYKKGKIISFSLPDHAVDLNYAGAKAINFNNGDASFSLILSAYSNSFEFEKWLCEIILERRSISNPQLRQ